jgi:gliding motility-associated-like protein
VNDNCNLQQGGIAAIKVNGLSGPTTYTWYNQNNTVTGNAINLQNAGAGNYILEVNDAGVCKVQSNPFVILNADNSLAAPLYDSIVIPRNSDANLILKNPAAGTYRLMTSATGGQMIQQNNYGDFIILNIPADINFYVQRTNGTCASTISKVNIKVVDKSFFVIPGAFTPNGDGVNDYLAAKVIGYINLNYFKIYNKWGELVFETHQLNKGWDGSYKNKLQNQGSFVWIAEGTDINGKIVSGKGISILIR